MTEALPIGVGEFARTAHGIFKDLDRLRCTCGWVSLAGDEATAAEAAAHVAKMSIGSNKGPELDPFETLKQRIDELAATAKDEWGKLPEITNSKQAENADTFLTEVGSFNFRKTDKGALHKLYDEKERELQPHRDALAEIKNRYDPVVLTALRAKEVVNKLLHPWQNKQKKALEAVGASPDVARAGASVQGEYSTRRRPPPAPSWEVEITDALLAFVYYQEVVLIHPDFLALLRGLARHEARDTKGRREIPGVRITPNEGAA